MAAAPGDGADFVDEEGRLFPGGEVPAAAGFVPVHDVGEAALGLAAGGSRYFFGEDAASGRFTLGKDISVLLLGPYRGPREVAVVERAQMVVEINRLP